MNSHSPKVVMMDSDEAASIQTLTGWVDRQGRFWEITNIRPAGVVQRTANVENIRNNILHTLLTVIVNHAEKKIAELSLQK